MYKFFSNNTFINCTRNFIRIKLNDKNRCVREKKTDVLIDGGGGGSGKDASHSSENDDREELVADDEFIIMFELKSILSSINCIIHL